MRGAPAVVGLCLLLALAGCSALPGFPTDQDSQPPGVDDGELVDADALLDAHAETLTESGYSHDLVVNQTVETDDGTRERTTRQRTSVAAGAGQYLQQVLLSGGQLRIISWGNGTVEYVRVDSGGNTNYQRGNPTDARNLTAVTALAPFLTAPFEVVDTDEVDGRTVYALRSTGRPDHEGAFPDNATDVAAFDARLIVDEAGRIHRLNATADYRLDGEPGSYAFTFELTATADPGVSRPAWVDEIAQ